MILAEPASGRGPVRALIVSLCAVALAGCAVDASDGADAALEVVVDTVEGVPNIAVAGAGPRWAAQPVVEIAADPTAPAGGPTEFGRVASLAISPAGDIFVPDTHAAEIRVFDRDGTFLSRIGRRGAGPGEFGTLQQLGWLGDTLVVMDPAHARLGLLSAGGEWLGQRPWQPLTGDVRLIQSGPHVVHVQVTRPGAGGRLARTFVRHTAAAETDTLVAPSIGTVRPAIICRDPTDRSFTAFSPPFAHLAWTLYTFLPDGTAVIGDGEEYRLEFHAPDGRLLRVVTREHRPAAISDADWAAERAEYDAYRRDRPAANCDGEPRRPERQPALHGLWLDDELRLWVEVLDAEGLCWDLYTSEGTPLGTVPVPDALRDSRDRRVTPVVRSGRLHVVVLDSFDVPGVRGYQLEPPAARSR